MNLIGPFVGSLVGAVSEARSRREVEGGGQREVAGGASNDDELWGTQFFLLRLRSADKHARQVCT